MFKIKFWGIEEVSNINPYVSLSSDRWHVSWRFSSDFWSSLEAAKKILGVTQKMGLGCHHQNVLRTRKWMCRLGNLRSQRNLV